LKLGPLFHSQDTATEPHAATVETVETLETETHGRTEDRWRFVIGCAGNMLVAGIFMRIYMII
jgi:hypothetical protein